MKKLIALILTLTLALSLCACGQKAGEPAPTETPEETPVLPTPEVALLTPEGEDGYNDLSFMCLEACGELRLIDPKINLRVSDE